MPKDGAGKSWTNWHLQKTSRAAPRPQWPSWRRALRVAGNFPRELLSNLLEVGDEGPEERSRAALRG